MNSKRLILFLFPSSSLLSIGGIITHHNEEAVSLDTHTLTTSTFHSVPWDLSIGSVSDLEGLGMMTYQAFPIGIYLIGVLLLALLIGVLAICTDEAGPNN